MCFYVSKICADGNFSVFSLVTKKCEKWVENSPSFKLTPFWNVYSKNENNYIFRRKLSQLYEKDKILHVTITVFLKQRQTRASSGPITVPFITKSVTVIF